MTKPDDDAQDDRRTDFQRATTKALAGIKRAADPDTVVQIVAAESLAEVADRARAALDDRLLLSASRQLTAAVEALRSGTDAATKAEEPPPPDPLEAALASGPSGGETKPPRKRTPKASA